MIATCRRFMAENEARHATHLRHRGRRGQILIITLLAITLLAGLIFYVYNVGRQVNNRMAMQHAADASAISGANWMARSMNVIAMNNCNMSRMLALAVVLDSMPLAAEITLAEEQGIDSLPQCLQNQLASGVPDTSIERDDFLRRGLQKLLNQMQIDNTANASQFEMLQSLYQSLKSDDQRAPVATAYDIGQVTHWAKAGSDTPYGKLWQAARTLDELSQATVSAAPLLSQQNAVGYGKMDRAQASFMLPILPQLPAVRGQFRDFKPVMMDWLRVIDEDEVARYGQAYRYNSSNLVQQFQSSGDVLATAEHTSVRGGAIPDAVYPYRLGPFARLYMWRGTVNAGGGISYGNGDQSYQRTGPGGTGSWRPIGYGTYGPVEWAENTIYYNLGQAGHTSGALDSSRFSHHLRRITNLKLAYMFGLSAPQKIQYADKWLIDYPTAKKLGTDPDPKKRKQILRTRYYWPAVRSSIKWDDPRWMADPSTWASRVVEPLNDPPSSLWAWEPWGWYDQDKQPAYQFIKRDYDRDGVIDFTEEIWREKVCDYVWRVKKEYTYITYIIGGDPSGNKIYWPGDPRLGLGPKFDKDGRPIPCKVYTVDWYVFGGCELRDEVEISNPCNWAPGDALPAPLLLDTSKGDYDPNDLSSDAGIRREQFTFLGLAGTTAKTPSTLGWGSRFTPGNPSGRNLALAQVELFNNRSWDLWTQDWQTQLVPVTKYDDWVNRLRLQAADAVQTQGLVEPQDVQETLEYLSRLDPKLAELFMKH